MPATLPKTRSYPLFDFETEPSRRTQQNTGIPDSSNGRPGGMTCYGAEAPSVGAPPTSQPNRRHFVRPRASSTSSSSSLLSSSPPEHLLHHLRSAQPESDDGLDARGRSTDPSFRSGEDDINREERIQDDTVTYTLYLIRHGEASHNVLEKAAKKRALVQARAEGLPDNHPETKRRLEAARVSVLDDKSLLDAPLSDEGIREALRAREDLAAVTRLAPPAPTQVLVSPLHRTLQTADLMFPDHPHISVWNGLRERQTGFPPDRRATPDVLVRRSMVGIPRSVSCSVQDILDDGNDDDDDDDINNGNERPASESNNRDEPVQKFPLAFPLLDDLDDNDSGEASVTDFCNSLDATATSSSKELFQNECIMHHHNHRCSSADSDNDVVPGNPKFVAENRGMLRLRTHKLLELLADRAAAGTEHRSIALVTHKGYIRELERGPFRQPEATECGNCEIRAYRIRLRLDDGDLLESAERIA